MATWNTGFETRIEFISPTAPAIRTLKNNVRKRCDLDHHFYLDGSGTHKTKTFGANHFKPGLFVQRLGDIELDQEFEFESALESIAVPGLQNSTHLTFGAEVYGFLRMKIEDLGFVGSTVRPTYANDNIRVGGDATVWTSFFDLEGVASYNGLDPGWPTAVNHVGFVSGGPYDSIFGEQRVRFGNMSNGIDDLIQDVRIVAGGHYEGSYAGPRLYLSLTIRGVEIVAPTLIPFSLTESYIYSPWVDVLSHGWTFQNDIQSIEDSYLTLDARQFGSVNALDLYCARLELRTGAAKFQDYHVSLVQSSTGKLITSSEPQNSWNKDWFWLPLDVIESSAPGGASLTRIQLYKDNYTEVNGKITVKELILYGR